MALKRVPYSTVQDFKDGASKSEGSARIRGLLRIWKADNAQ